MAIFNASIITGNDDGREGSGGGMNRGANEIIVSSGFPYGGLRFQDVTIPAGSTINSATLDIYVYGASFDDPDLDIHLQAIDDAPTLDAASNYLSTRPLTSAKTQWTASSVGTGVKTSPSFAAAVAEVIDRVGWASGQSILAVLKHRGGGEVRFYSYDNGSLYASITIDYTPPSANIDVELDMLGLSASALALAVVPGGVWLAMDLLTMAAGALSLAVTPGSVAIGLDLLTGVLEALEAIISVEGVDVSIDLSMLIAELAAESLTVVPGGVVVPVDLLAAVLSAYALDVIGESFDQIVQLALLSAAGGLPSLAIAPGAVTVPLSILEGQLALNDLIVFLMLGCAMAVDRGRYEAVAADAMRFYAVAADRDGCCS